MAKNLVIVESPAKAKTIEGFLGKDFLVKSSYGHVRDLKNRELSIDIEKGFEPIYEVTDDKKKVVAELKKLAKDAELVWLATDEDREGEAISWHLLETLGLKEENTRRIVFHEITKSAILKAIENPRRVDRHLVDAQQARRVLDRLVGFEVSPILWKKVKPSLSAGRVQSVTVRLLVEREREIQQFVAESYFRVVGHFQTAAGNPFKAELSKRLTAESEAQALLDKALTASFRVTSLETKPAKRTPAAPFTTSTLQQEAGRKLSFSVSRTMTLAQKLYEEGVITYMRTDSVNLSETAINAARQSIGKLYGDKYFKQRQFTNKAKGAQEAHEAIRPVDMGRTSYAGDAGAARLYDLIWKRTLASQMADAELERTTAHIAGNGLEHDFIARGEVIKFDGFLRVYSEGTDDESTETGEQEGLLPAMAQGETIGCDEIVATQRFTNHPPRYTESSLVKKLEELGIGRPSTYAPTISTIQKRGYAEKTDRDGTERSYRVLKMKGGKVISGTQTEITGAERSKLFPTDIGMVVNDFLVDHFERILDYNFTATVEKEFDEIAEGQLKWNKMIEKFYRPFHRNVEDTLENSDRASGERELGKDPQTGKTIYARIGRFGPMVQMGEATDEEKPRFASLRKDQSISNISLEEALDLFKLPRKLGMYEGQEVEANIGRFGPYIRHGKLFVSLPKEDDPMTVTLDRAGELIVLKRKTEAERIIKIFKEDDSYQILNGRWGPYLKAGKRNIKLPKDREPDTFTFEEVVELAGKEEASGKKAASARTTARKAPAGSTRKPGAASKTKKTAAKKPAAKKTTPKKK